MPKIINLKQHSLAIVLAAVIGLIVGMPHILIPQIIAPQKYDPLQFNSDSEGSSITMEEVYTYVPEIREILEGKFWVTDTQVAEYNGKPTPFAGESGLAWVMAGLAKLTGSMENAFVAADFLFPGVTFLLAYAIVWLFTKNRAVSAAAGTVLVIWPELSVLFPYPNALISAVKAAFDPRDFLFISRNFHPQLSLPAYLLAFLTAVKALEKKRFWGSVAAGLTSGFLFYTYIFNWTAFGLGLGLFLIYKATAAVIKRSDPAMARSDLMRLLVIVIVASLVAAPYFFRVWQFKQTGLAQDFFTKLSLPKRGFFDLTARHWIFVLLFFIVSLRKVISGKYRFSRFFDFGTHRTSRSVVRNDERSLILFLCFWIAPLILPDLTQHILGRDLEGKHWVRRVGYPLSIMGLGLIAGEIRKKWIKTTAKLFLAGVLIYGVAIQVSMSRKAAAAYATDKDKQELYDYIRTETPPGAVIASLGWDIVVNIPAKTHAFNFSPIGMRTIASTEETMDRFLWAAAIYGKSEDWVGRAFADDGIGTTRVYYFTHADEIQVFNAPPEIRENAVRHYRIIRQIFLAGEKPPFQLDYIVVGEFEKQIQFSKLVKQEIKPKFANSSYSLWEYPILFKN